MLSILSQCSFAKKIRGSMKITGIILAGGKGKRFLEVSGKIPKILFKINQKPLIDYSFDLFVESKLVDNIIVNIGYQAPEIISHVKGSGYDIDISFSKQTRFTIFNAINQALKRKECGEIIVLCSADEIRPNLHIDNALKWHMVNPNIATIIGVRNNRMLDYPLLECDKQMRVVRYLPSFNGTVTKNHFIHSGVLIFNRDIGKAFRLITDDWLSLTIPLIETGSSRLFYEVGGDYFNVGTKSEYEEVLRSLNLQS